MGSEFSLWECECGHTERGTYPPQECQKCWKIESFTEIRSDSDEDMEDLL